MAQFPPADEAWGDAPGWAAAGVVGQARKVGDAVASASAATTTTTSTTTTETKELGPVCFKCRGAGVVSRWTKVRDRSGTPPTESKETCRLCGGVGALPVKRLKRKTEPPAAAEKGQGDDATTSAHARPSSSRRRTREDWVPPGPPPAGVVAPEPDVSDEQCALVGQWRIFQRPRGGHRWSTDDLVTAWVACDEAKPHMPDNGAGLRTLDLGCGLGTVMLMTAWRFPGVRASGVEAQRASAELARKSVRYNGVADRVSVHVGDLRTVSEEDVGASSFRLVTGTPPYFPVQFDAERGVTLPLYGGLPTHAQSAPARFEFRGGLEEYVKTGARFVEPAVGRLVLCEGNLSARDPTARATRAAALAGVRIVRTVLVRGRSDKPPLFAVHVFVRETRELRIDRGFDLEEISIRFKGGKRTPEYLKLVEEMGVAPYVDEPDPGTGPGGEAVSEAAAVASVSDTREEADKPSGEEVRTG